MAQGSNDAAAIGATALRETAKWLVGGAVATAAGVLTGSTLTNFGHLPIDFRFALAVGGLLVGFLGIGLLIESAMKVMAYDAISHQELASGIPDCVGAQGGRRHLDAGQLGYMLTEIDRMFEMRPCKLPGFASAYELWKDREPDSLVIPFFLDDAAVVTDSARVSERRRTQPTTVCDAKVNELEQYLTDAIRAAQFFKVQYVFTKLHSAMRYYIGLMVVGFGSFAWAANPPDPPAHTPAITVNWPGR
jgi:hypothetical protein